MKNFDLSIRDELGISFALIKKTKFSVFASSVFVFFQQSKDSEKHKKLFFC